MIELQFNRHGQLQWRCRFNMLRFDEGSRKGEIAIVESGVENTWQDVAHEEVEELGSVLPSKCDTAQIELAFEGDIPKSGDAENSIVLSG